LDVRGIWTFKIFRLYVSSFSNIDFGKTNVLFCKDDASLPPGAYLGMAQGLGDFQLVEVSGSHESLFTNPGVVAEGLISAAT
jgi:hypothetical protein